MTTFILPGDGIDGYRVKELKTLDDLQKKIIEVRKEKTDEIINVIINAHGTEKTVHINNQDIDITDLIECISIAGADIIHIFACRIGTNLAIPDAKMERMDYQRSKVVQDREEKMQTALQKSQNTLAVVHAGKYNTIASINRRKIEDLLNKSQESSQEVFDSLCHQALISPQTYKLFCKDKEEKLLQLKVDAPKPEVIIGEAMEGDKSITDVYKKHFTETFIKILNFLVQNNKYADLKDNKSNLLGNEESFKEILISYLHQELIMAANEGKLERVNFFLKEETQKYLTSKEIKLDINFALEDGTPPFASLPKMVTQK